jgi:hypothetical protein
MNVKDFVLNEANKGMTNDEYLALMEKEIKEKDTLELQEEEKYLLDITKLNFQRSSRIKKTYKPSDEIISAIENIEKKQLWMVLTEPWCGDSAQNLPYIAKIAELNYNIDFRILLRDENPEIMDQYLTNGKSRSIPKLVAFDDEGKELFQWGPRPKLAQEMVNNWKAEGLSKDEFIEKLHLWYGRNRGEELEKEFIELLMRK